MALQERIMWACRGKATAALKESRANFGSFREPKDQSASGTAPESSAASSASSASQRSPGSIRSSSSMRS